MKYTCKIHLLFTLLISFSVCAEEEEGFKWGMLYVRPEASVLGAYDSRVQINNLTGKAIDDHYAEMVAGLTVNNLPARYDLSAKASYGYRMYSDNSDFDDNFYTYGGAIGASEDPLKWRVSSELKKRLSYNTNYDTSTQERPDSILTDRENKLWTARAKISYEKQTAEKTSIVPAYSFLYYHHELESSDTAEWQVHSLGLEAKHVYSPKTILLAGGQFSQQFEDEEDGIIGTVYVGAEGRVTDKTSWKALFGFTAVDYDESGSDQAGYVDLQALWQATEKISAYLFAGNDYQPGYDGGPARLIYRAGYGVKWRFASRWAVGGQVLHDYEKSVESGDGISNGVRHWISADCAYNITKKLLLSLNGRYADDEFKKSQQVFGLKLDYKY